MDNPVLDWWFSWVIIPCICISTIALLAVIVYRQEKERK